MLDFNSENLISLIKGNSSKQYCCIVPPPGEKMGEDYKRNCMLF